MDKPLATAKHPITVKQLIDALQKLENQDNKVTFIIKSATDRYGKEAFLESTVAKGDSYEFWVSNGYGASITICLDSGVYISDRRK